MTFGRICARCGKLKAPSDFTRWTTRYDPEDDGSLCWHCYLRLIPRRKGREEVAQPARDYQGDRAHKRSLTTHLAGAAWSMGRCSCGKRGRLFDGMCYACRQAMRRVAT